MTSRSVATPADLDRPRRMTRGMRWFLRAGALLAIIAGTQLTLLTEHTDLYFFWTIDSPITAAFLGATFSAASLLALVASRQDHFIRAGLAVPAVAFVSTLLLIATLQHLEARSPDQPDLDRGLRVPAAGDHLLPGAAARRAGT